jgi:hypothetical protein
MDTPQMKHMFVKSLVLAPLGVGVCCFGATFLGPIVLGDVWRAWGVTDAFRLAGMLCYALALGAVVAMSVLRSPKVEG